jgi:hypothetical protein
MSFVYYYLYEIKNALNGKIYIGVHKTKNMSDNYMGSGKAIQNAIKKYGIENFIKTILETFDNEESMFLREREIVSEDFIKRKDVYNIKCGGHGGWEYVHNNKIKTNKWHTFDEEKKTHIKEKIKMTKKVHPPTPLSAESRKKISDFMKLNNPMFNEDTKNKIKNKLTGLTKTQEHKEKISKALKNKVKEKGRKLKPGRKYSVPRIMSDSICPHCNKPGKLNAMRRWHFDNCKLFKGP